MFIMWHLENGRNPNLQNSRNSPHTLPWARRLVEAKRLHLDDRKCGWWSFHLEGFLRYCRRRGEQADARILAKGYLEELATDNPPVSIFRQDMTVLVRGIEN